MKNILLLIPTKEYPEPGNLYVDEDGDYYHRHNEITDLPSDLCYKVKIKIWVENTNVLTDSCIIIDDEKELHQLIIDKKLKHGDSILVKQTIIRE